MSDLEKELFSKVCTINYYTTIPKIKGFQHIPVGLYHFGEYIDDPVTSGSPVAMQRFHTDTDIFLFWSYRNSMNVRGPCIEELAMKAFNSMGGVVERVILQRQFKYFPHVGPKGMRNFLCTSYMLFFFNARNLNRSLQPEYRYEEWVL